MSANKKTISEKNEQRRNIRRGYRKLIREQTVDKDQIVGGDGNRAQSLLKKGDELFLKVDHTREAALDSQFLATAASYGKESVSKMQTGLRTIDRSEFIQRLLIVLDKGVLEDPDKQGQNNEGAGEDGAEDDDDVEEEEEDDDAAAAARGRGGRQGRNGAKNRRDARLAAARAATRAGEQRPDNERGWLGLGRAVMARGFLRRTPALDTVFGPLTVKEKLKKAPQKRAPKEHHELITPDEITTNNSRADQATEDTETGRRVGHLRTVIRQHTGDSNLPVDFFQLTMNPHSFAQSVENVFHLAFLVNKGKAKTMMTSDGRCMVQLADPPLNKDYESGAARRSQAIVALDMETWRQACDLLQLQEPMIPSRKTIDKEAHYLPSVSDAIREQALAKARQEQATLEARQQAAAASGGRPGSRRKKQQRTTSTTTDAAAAAAAGSGKKRSSAQASINLNDLDDDDDDDDNDDNNDDDVAADHTNHHPDSDDDFIVASPAAPKSKAASNQQQQRQQRGKKRQRAASVDNAENSPNDSLGTEPTPTKKTRRRRSLSVSDSK